MITLFGATGYTGRLIAQALDGERLPFRLAGRSAARLATLSNSLDTLPPWLVADVHRPESLLDLCIDTTLLINCVGPFTDLGEPVVARAVQSGVAYLDIDNELGFLYRARAYDTLARANGAVIIPSCAFEVALADCAAALLAAQFEGRSLDEVSVTYALSGMGSSRGTRRSIARTLATSWLGYRDGQWVTAVPGRRVREITLSDKRHAALAIPSGEIITIPQHVKVKSVNTWLALRRRGARWTARAVPQLGRLLRGPLGPLGEKVMGRSARPPDDEQRARSGFVIGVEAIAGEERRALLLRGHDPYGLTARIICYAARVLSQAEHQPGGVFSPAQVLGPEAFLDHAEYAWELTVSDAG